jgi:hypothetical protein
LGIAALKDDASCGSHWARLAKLPSHAAMGLVSRRLDGVTLVATVRDVRIRPPLSGAAAAARPVRRLARQLNCAIHRIAVTQIRCHPDAQAYLKHRIAAGDSKTEALRALKGRLSDIVYQALLADGTTVPVGRGSLT